jgi:hypothetical protein
MADIVNALFGVTPESYQQAQQDRADAQAMQFARLSPFEKASFGIGSGAYGLAGAIGGALGGQDPELQRRTQAQQILGMIDPNRPETFDQGAQMALQAGDQQLAYGLRMEGDKYRQLALTRGDEALVRKDAQTKRDLEAAALLERKRVQGISQGAYVPPVPEQQQFVEVDAQGQLVVIPAQPASFDIQRVAPELMKTAAGRAELKNLIDAQKLTMPETVSIKENETIYSVPTTPGGAYKAIVSGGEKPTPFTGDMANAALTLYQTNDPAKIFSKFGQAGLNAVQTKALETTKLKQPITNVTNTVSNNMNKGFGDTFIDNVSSNIKAGRAALGALSAVQNMQTLLDEGVKTGFAQDTMLQLGRAGQFFDPEFKVKGLAGQEAFQSFATGVILPQVKQLGVNPTDADLKFISTGSPSLSKTPEGNKLLLSALQLKLNREQDMARFTNQFLASNQELVTKNPVQAYTKFNDAFDQYTQTSPLYGLASESLRQRFNALGTQAQGSPAARGAAERGGLISPRTPR